MMLKLFHVDIESFAVAGAFVIFLMSLEMILDIEIFKNQGPIKEATLVPLVFPLLAGAGAFTTLLSLRAEYASVNIIIALVLNMIWVYFVVSMTGRVERFSVRAEFILSASSSALSCWRFPYACLWQIYHCCWRVFIIKTVFLLLFGEEGCASFPSLFFLFLNYPLWDFLSYCGMNS